MSAARRLHGMDNQREDQLAQAERHIREGEAQVAQQKGLVAELQAIGEMREIGTARTLLQTMERSLDLARAGLRHERLEHGPKPVAPGDRDR